MKKDNAEPTATQPASIYTRAAQLGVTVSITTNPDLQSIPGLLAYADGRPFLLINGQLGDAEKETVGHDLLDRHERGDEPTARPAPLALPAFPYLDSPPDPTSQLFGRFVATVADDEGLPIQIREFADDFINDMMNECSLWNNAEFLALVWPLLESRIPHLMTTFNTGLDALTMLQDGTRTDTRSTGATDKRLRSMFAALRAQYMPAKGEPGQEEPAPLDLTATAPVCDLARHITAIMAHPNTPPALHDAMAEALCDLDGMDKLKTNPAYVAAILEANQ